MKYFRKNNNKIKINFYTNGSARDIEWWKELAKIVDYCQFDID
jgi:hypothetical protein